MIKLFLRLFMLAVLISPACVTAQIPLSQYQYSTGVDASRWLSLPTSAPALMTNSAGYGASPLISTDFPIVFAGSTYNHFSVNHNGLLRLGATVITDDDEYFGPFAEDNISSNLPKIAGFGEMGYMESNDYIKYATLGTAPNRILVIEFRVPYIENENAIALWQVQFFETSNTVQLVYGDNPGISNPDMFQIGMATSATDVFTINTTNHTIVPGLQDFYYMDSPWPAYGRYYRFETATACFPPSLFSIVEISHDYANLSWESLGSELGWLYTYTLNGESPDWANASITTIPSVILLSLLSDTTYQLHIRSICSATDTSAPNTFSFHTLCAPINPPYIENFDTYTTDIAEYYGRPSSYPNHTLPTCCQFAPMVETRIGGPAAWLTNQPNFEGGDFFSIDSVSLRFIADTLQPNYMILPLCASPLSSLHLQFDYATQPQSAALQMGVLTNPSDLSTFIPLHTCLPSINATTVNHYFRYDTILDFNQTYYITFLIGNSNGKITTLDNLSLTSLPSCIVPGNITLPSISANQVKISWRTDAPQSQVALRHADSTQWFDTIVNDTTALLHNLMQRNNYFIKVRAICNAGDTSLWSDSIPFRTPCSARQLPFYEDFSSLNSNLNELICWSFYDLPLNHVLSGIAPVVEQPYNDWDCYPYDHVISDGSASLNIQGFSLHEWLVTPPIYFSSDARLSFDLALTTYGDTTAASGIMDDDRFALLASTDNGRTWSILSIWDSSTSNPHRFANIPFLPQTITIDMSQFTYNEVRLAFYGESSMIGGDNEIHIGHIRVQSLGSVTCPIPTHLNATPSTTAANISWRGDDHNYEISYRLSTNHQWSPAVTVNTHSHTLSNLVPGQTYIYRICQQCEDDVFSDWVESSFTTLSLPCEVPTILSTQVHHLESTISWSSIPNADAYELHLFSPTTDTLITTSATTHTLHSLLPITTYQLSIRTQCSDSNYSDWSDTIRFTTQQPPFQCPTPINLTIQLNGLNLILDWQSPIEQSQWEVSLSDGIDELFYPFIHHPATIEHLLPATNYTIKVRAICAEGLYSDWSESLGFTTGELPTCPAITNLSLSHLSSNSATIQWSAGADEHAWQLQYGLPNFDPQHTEIITINTTQYQLTHLDSNTTYHLYVRAICGDNHYSEWSNVLQFTTLNSDTPESIDDIRGNSQFNIYPNPTTNATTIRLNGIEGKVVITITDINGRILQTETLNATSHYEHRLALTHLPQGTYFVHLLSTTHSAVRKLIIR